MVSCPNLANNGVNGGDDITCQKANGGFGFWIISEIPTADQMAKMCANPTCMGIVASIKKVQPTECVVSFGFTLYAEVINPIEAVCSGKPVAPAPAPAPVPAPAATPAPAPAATAAPGTVPPQAAPSGPVANGAANATSSALTTPPTAAQVSTSGGGNSQLPLIVAIAGVVIVVVALIGFFAYRAGNKRKRRRRRDDDDYYRPQRTERVAPPPLRDEYDARFADIEAGQRYDDRKASNKPSANLTNASTASTAASTSSNLSQVYRSSSSKSTKPRQTGLWIDLDINDRRVKYEEIIISTNLAPLGRGAFCEVRAAKYDQRDVAVKRLLPTKQHDPELQTMLLAEVKTMTTLNHKNIVQLVGVAWDEPHDLCIVMELVKGTDMGKYMAHNNHARGFTTEKIEMALQIADALAYMHGQKPPVIHRDLKSANILLTGDNQAKIADFGFTRANTATLKTMQIGTKRWMAPELALTNKYDAQVDIFSFGVLLSELDTFEEPYSQSLQGREISDAEFFASVRNGRLAVTFSNDRDPVAQLGRECVCVIPNDRPKAAQLFARLQKLYHESKQRDDQRTLTGTF